ncbi:MAG: acyl-CoA thioesterase [Kiritimatiellia bacterium]
MSTTTYMLVRPEHLNHYGFLFGGNLLKWVDEVAWMAASRDFPTCLFLTVAMEQVEFKRRSGNGDLLRVEAEKNKQGHTSVHYRVEVFRKPPESAREEIIFSTIVTLVRVDAQGRKTALPE